MLSEEWMLTKNFIKYYLQPIIYSIRLIESILKWVINSALLDINCSSPGLVLIN